MSKTIGERLKMVKDSMGAVTKSAKNPFFKSSYADLNTHLAVVEDALSANGFILTQPVMIINDRNVIVSRVTDAADNETVLESAMVLPDLEKMQDMGSAITYARRYTLGSLFAMQAKDDDANIATKAKVVKRSNNRDF